MAGKVRHLVNRSGRYHARLVVLQDLRAITGKTELRSALDGNYRQALKLLPGAVGGLPPWGWNAATHQVKAA